MEVAHGAKITAMQFLHTGGVLKLSPTKPFVPSIKYISVSVFNTISLCHFSLLHIISFMV